MLFNKVQLDSLFSYIDVRIDQADFPELEAARKKAEKLLLYVPPKISKAHADLKSVSKEFGFSVNKLLITMKAHEDVKAKGPLFTAYYIRASEIKYVNDLEGVLRHNWDMKGAQKSFDNHEN